MKGIILDTEWLMEHRKSLTQIRKYGGLPWWSRGLFAGKQGSPGVHPGQGTGSHMPQLRPCSQISKQINFFLKKKKGMIRHRETLSKENKSSCLEG